MKVNTIKYLLMTLLINIFTSCNLQKPELINVYAFMGQSNANEVWYESIKAEIVKVDPTAIFIHNNHPGNEIANWYTATTQHNYIEDISKIKNNLPESDYRFAGLFWYQGESDWQKPDEYKDKFYGLISELEDDLGFHNFPIFMNIVSSNTTTTAMDKIRAVQFGIVKDNWNIHGSDTYGYERLSDKTTHMPDYCYIEIGNKIAELAIDILYRIKP